MFAHIITAGLRTNPQFFTDMQQVPDRLLAPNQVDVNFAYPMDVSGKRKARVRSAVCVLRSVAWKYQNFLRMQLAITCIRSSSIPSCCRRWRSSPLSGTRK